VAIQQTFDVVQGETLRDEAVRRVEDHAPVDWNKQALAAVKFVAERKREFSTDAVWQVLEQRGIGGPPEPRALGAVMRRAVRVGLVEATDRVEKSRRPECHRRPVKLWRSRAGL
jgi:hypothetical protein